MKFKIKLQNKEYEVEIDPVDKKKTKIKIEEEEFLFGKDENKEKVAVARTSLPRRNFRKKEVKAPIAGVISDIFIKEGEFIKKGKKLFLLSAMKMENEIISDHDGKVKEIKTEKGKEVKEGNILMILE